MTGHHATFLVLLLAVRSAPATEMVYTPVNPNFGGSPLNASPLLNSAQATNKHTDPQSSSRLGGSAFGQRTALQQFNDTLERSILSQLASSATSRILGPTGQLIPGTVETGNFRITITDIGNGLLQISTTDKVTGDSTSFQVGQ